jgi:diguanylate cyclase
MNAAATQEVRRSPVTCPFFDTSPSAAECDHCLLDRDLRGAISRGELRLVYQPQKDIRTDEVLGFEALLRWKHATRGEVSPAEFIPIAEDTGTILQIGEWVMQTACREAATWIKPLAVAINVSAVQIENANFAGAVHEILFETGLAPARLELEVTETALIRDLDCALATLRRIMMLGVRIAMDDFGSGHSALSNLLTFPFDKIKIDRCLIKSVTVNDKAAAVVRSVLALGRALKLPVLAEGVENKHQLEFLKNELCDQAQGYLFGWPDNIEHFRELTHGSAMELVHRKRIEDVRCPRISGLPVDIVHLLHHTFVGILQMRRSIECADAVVASARAATNEARTLLARLKAEGL